MSGTTSPYHEGERAVQREVGARDIAKRTGSVIDTEVSEAAIPFVSRQSMAVATTIDGQGRAWCEILVGPSGFVEAESERVRIHAARRRGLFGTAWVDSPADDPRVGLLFVELETRKRLRVNGEATVKNRDVVVSVEEAYPNCPKYIQSR